MELFGKCVEIYNKNTIKIILDNLKVVDFELTDITASTEEENKLAIDYLKNTILNEIILIEYNNDKLIGTVWLNYTGDPRAEDGYININKFVELEYREMEYI